MDYTKEQKRARYLELPDSVKDILESEEVGKTVQEIGRKYRLHIDQDALLLEEATTLMLGMVTSDEFVGRLISKARIPREDAAGIAREVGDKILSQIANAVHEMKNSHVKKEEESVLGDETNHQLSPVEIGAQRFDLSNAKTTEEHQNPPASDRAPSTAPTLSAQAPAVTSAYKKLEGPVGYKKTETVIDDSEETSAEEESTAKTNNYPGGADPYHEPIE